MKKIFITLISLCLILSLAPVSAFAAVTPAWPDYYPEQLLVFCSDDNEAKIEDGKIYFATKFDDEGNISGDGGYSTSLLEDTIPFYNYIRTDSTGKFLLGFADTENNCVRAITEGTLNIDDLHTPDVDYTKTPNDGKYSLDIKRFGKYELSVNVGEKKYWCNLNVSLWRRFDPNELFIFAKSDSYVKGLADVEDKFYKMVQYTMEENGAVLTEMDEKAPFRQEFTLEEANAGFYISEALYEEREDGSRNIFGVGLSPRFWIKEYGKDYPIDQGEERGDMYEPSEDGSYKFNLEDKKVYQIYHSHWSTLIGIGDFKDTYSSKLMYKLPGEGNVPVVDNTIDLNNTSITTNESGKKQIYMLIEKSKSEILTEWAYMEFSSKWRNYGKVITEKSEDGSYKPKVYKLDGKDYNAFAISLSDAKSGDAVSFGTVHGRINMFPITGIKITETTPSVTPPSAGGSAPVNPVDTARTEANSKLAEIVKAVDTADFTEEEKKTIADINAETSEALKSAKTEEEIKKILDEAEVKIQTAEANYTISHNTVDFKIKAVTKVLKNGGVSVSFSFVNGEEGIEQLKAKGYKISYQFMRSTAKNGKYTTRLTKDIPTYRNTAGKQGKKYFYKMALKIEDPNGRVVYETPLDKCVSGSSVFKK